ncbi:MAG: DUF2188 domain-containing protein [Anaerolineae bacterium]|nr:DUF2188 domain-containing protein [Anaerolineae bacterium]
MPWNQKRYPDSMKNLEPHIRAKAIEIANALIDEDYPDERAIPIAIAQAKKWAENGADDSVPSSLHIVSHLMGWAIRRANAQKASFVYHDLAKARDKAIAMAQKESVTIILHDEDGGIKDYIDFPKV